MNDYIERDKIGLTDFEIILCKGSYKEALLMLFNKIEHLPAADVRPVVLCKNCRNDCHCMIQDFMKDYGVTPDDQNNFFCGYGVKKEKN